MPVTRGYLLISNALLTTGAHRSTTNSLSHNDRDMTTHNERYPVWAMFEMQYCHQYLFYGAQPNCTLLHSLNLSVL